MNILFIKDLFVGFMVSEIPRVSVFDYFPLYNVGSYIKMLKTSLHINNGVIVKRNARRLFIL